jgi:hypothetical protein
VGADLAAIKRSADATIEHIRGILGDEAWSGGMHPELPGTDVLDNPYQYTEYKADSNRNARGSLFGEPQETTEKTS